MTARQRRFTVGLSGLAVGACLALGGLWYANAPGRTSTEPAAAEADVRLPKESSELALDEEERQFLWEVEHHGLVLSRHGFSSIADALRRTDGRALTALLADQFQGSDLRQPREVRAATAFADVVRREDSGQLPEALDRAQFVDRLLSYRRRFSQPPNVQLALMRLTPEVRGTLDSPWLGTCQLRLWGEMGPGEPGEVVLVLRYRVPRPVEETFGKVGWLAACDITQSLVSHAPRPLMREVAAERGIDPRGFHDNWYSPPTLPNTGGVYVCDYNRDGILDVLVTDIRRYALFRGLPNGKFVEVTEELSLPRVPKDSGAFNAAIADLDGDGWEDLILGQRIYRNQEGRAFVDVTDRSNLRLPNDAGSIALADFDRDGRIDLYVTRAGKPRAASWIDGKGGDRKGNQLWRNKGNWQFEDVTEASGADGGKRSTFTAVWLDADNDGWPDLYVINEFGNGVLLHNRGNGTFQEQQLAAGPSDFGTMGVTCGDIDNDGNIDLYCANMYSKAGSRVIGNLKPGTYPESIMATMRQFVAGSQLWRNLGTDSTGRLRAERLGGKCQVASVGWAYGPALADLDNDGFLDLYATAGFISQSRSDPDG
jgi:hypothetical protein